RPGSTYTFSAFAYQDDARIRSVYLQIRWRPNPDGTGADLSVTESTFRLTDRQRAFRPLTTGPVSAPGQALSAVVTLVIVPFGVDPGAVYFDDATFVGDAPLPTSTPTQTPTTTSTATPTATADITTGRPGDVIISELIYDPATSP